MDGGSGGCRTKPPEPKLFKHGSSSSPLVGLQPEGARKEVFAGGRLDPQGIYGTLTTVRCQNVKSVCQQKFTFLLCTRFREIGGATEEQSAAEHHSRHTVSKGA